MSKTWWCCPHCPAKFDFKNQAEVHIKYVHVNNVPELLRRVVELLEARDE